MGKYIRKNLIDKEIHIMGRIESVVLQARKKGKRTAEEIAEITGLPLKTVYNYIPRNVTDMQGNVVRYVFNANDSSVEYWRRCVKAWMPLPEPYKGVNV